MQQQTKKRKLQIANKRHVRLLVSARAYQPVNSIFLSQQISISRVYQSRNRPTNWLKET